MGGISLTPYKMRISTAHLLQLTFVTIMHTAALILFLLGKQSWQGEALTRTREVCSAGWKWGRELPCQQQSEDLSKYTET